MGLYWLENSIQLEQIYADENLFELSRTFPLTNPHNSLKVGRSFGHLYQNLFQIWIRRIQIDFIAIFRFERFYTIHITSTF